MSRMKNGTRRNGGDRRSVTDRRQGQDFTWNGQERRCGLDRRDEAVERRVSRDRRTRDVILMAEDSLDDKRSGFDRRNEPGLTFYY